MLCSPSALADLQSIRERERDRERENKKTRLPSLRLHDPRTAAKLCSIKVGAAAGNSWVAESGEKIIIIITIQRHSTHSARVAAVWYVAMPPIK